MHVDPAIHVKDFLFRGIILRHTGRMDQALRREVNGNYV